jgi:hypothetical protein
MIYKKTRQMFTSGVRLSGDRTSRKKSEGLKFLGHRLPVELKKGIASATSPEKKGWHDEESQPVAVSRNLSELSLGISK